MAKATSVLFVASEIFPYVKFGGVADFAFSFSLALRGMGHDVRVMMPRYGNISERRHHIHFIKRLTDIPLKIADHEELITVKSSSISNTRYKVQSYITTNFNYFDQRKAIYHDPQTGLPFPDNDERFILFSRSVVETCLLLNWFPEIIHCNDWQTALVPVIAKSLYPNKFRKTRFVLTVYNFANQGEFPESTFDKIGLPPETKSNLMWNGKFNFLKGGIVYSDYITTVSPTYAEEVLQKPEISSGLNEILLSRNNNFCGIMNGIDPWQWNPRFDNDIACPLNNSNFDIYKSSNKQDLLKSLGISANTNIPVIGMISHLEENKGIRLLIDSLSKLMKEDIIIVLLGMGAPNLTKQLEKASQKYVGKFIFKNIFDERLAHKIEAGSDIFLMPSIYEPCGYNAIYSIVYGTVPIVRATGGLLDSVEQFDPKTKKGTGFFFNEPTPTELVQVVKEVLNYYHDNETWKTIVSNCLQKQFLWRDSIDKYVEIYRQLLKT
jgi:starch synthase